MRNQWLKVTASFFAANTCGGESAADKIMRAKNAPMNALAKALRPC